MRKQQTYENLWQGLSFREPKEKIRKGKALFEKKIRDTSLEKCLY